MRTHHLPAGRRARHPDPIIYAVRRAASSIVVLAALVAIGAAAVVDTLGLPVEIALLAATAVFVVLSVAAGTVVSPAPAAQQPNDGASTIQLGPDTEQEVSRATGART